MFKIVFYNYSSINFIVILFQSTLTTLKRLFGTERVKGCLADLCIVKERLNENHELKYNKYSLK